MAVPRQLVEEEAEVSIQALCQCARVELVPDLPMLVLTTFLALAAREKPQGQELSLEPIHEAGLLGVKDLLNDGAPRVDACPGQA